MLPIVIQLGRLSFPTVSMLMKMHAQAQQPRVASAGRHRLEPLQRAAAACWTGRRWRHGAHGALRCIIQKSLTIDARYTLCALHACELIMLSSYFGTSTLQGALLVIQSMMYMACQLHVTSSHGHLIAMCILLVASARRL